MAFRDMKGAFTPSSDSVDEIYMGPRCDELWWSCFAQPPGVDPYGKQRKKGSDDSKNRKASLPSSSSKPNVRVEREASPVEGENIEVEADPSTSPAWLTTNATQRIAMWRKHFALQSTGSSAYETLLIQCPPLSSERTELFRNSQSVCSRVEFSTAWNGAKEVRFRAPTISSGKSGRAPRETPRILNGIHGEQMRECSALCGSKRSQIVYHEVNGGGGMASERGSSSLTLWTAGTDHHHHHQSENPPGSFSVVRIPARDFDNNNSNNSTTSATPSPSPHCFGGEASQQRAAYENLILDIFRPLPRDLLPSERVRRHCYRVCALLLTHEARLLQSACLPFVCVAAVRAAPQDPMFSFELSLFLLRNVLADWVDPSSSSSAQLVETLDKFTCGPHSARSSRNCSQASREESLMSLCRASLERVWHHFHDPHSGSWSAFKRLTAIVPDDYISIPAQTLFLYSFSSTPETSDPTKRFNAPPVATLSSSAAAASSDSAQRQRRESASHVTTIAAAPRKLSKTSAELVLSPNTPSNWIVLLDSVIRRPDGVLFFHAVILALLVYFERELCACTCASEVHAVVCTPLPTIGAERHVLAMAHVLANELLASDAAANVRPIRLAPPASGTKSKVNWRKIPRSGAASQSTVPYEPLIRVDERGF